MLIASDGVTIGEKWTTVLPSEIDVDFFFTVQARPPFYFPSLFWLTHWFIAM